MKRAMALLEQRAQMKKDLMNSDLPLSSTGTPQSLPPAVPKRMPSAGRASQLEDKTKLIQNTDTNNSSRKSTAVSTTSRIGSGGGVTGKRTLGSSKFDSSDLMEPKDKITVFETSL